MHRYMCSHNWSPGQFTREQICDLADNLQHETDIRGYRSFTNVAEGKACCILEADSRETLATWFDKHNVPYDDITLVELEGERGVIQEVVAVAAT